MSSVANPSFEIAGATPGQPQSWHRLGRRTASKIFAGFATRDSTTLRIQAPNSFEAGLDWTPSEVIVAADADTAPDGTTSADFAEESAANATHYIPVTQPRALLADHSYMFGVYAKASGRSRVGLGFLLSTSAQFGAIFDLSTPGVLILPDAVDDVAEANVSALADVDGWVRVELSFLMRTTLVASPAIHILNTQAFGAYAGIPGLGILLWGAYIYEGERRRAETIEVGWEGSETFSAEIVIADDRIFSTGLSDPSGTLNERFETGWSNYPLFTYALLAAHPFVGSANVDSFETGWAASQVVHETAQTSVAMMFGGDAFDSFEDDWSGSETLSETFASSTAALWDYDQLNLAEQFEASHKRFAASVDLTTDVITASGHTFSDGDPVFLEPQAGGALPVASGVNSATRLYARSVVASTSMRVSLTPAGPLIDFTEIGFGDFYVVPDPRRFWETD